MLNTAILVIMGMFLGWNFPQPTYAKALQELVKAKWAAFRTRPAK